MLQTAAYSDIGGRECNEDCVQLFKGDADSFCFVLADGLGGHGGGDRGIIRSFCQMIAGTYTGKSISDISTSIKNHITAFAAEQSRLDGCVIDISEYIQTL